MPDFTPRDEITDSAIAAAHELLGDRLAGRPMLATLPLDPQRLWELLITVARSVASALRPDGNLEPGPIGHRNIRVLADLRRRSVHRTMAQIESLALAAGQLVGCAADEDYAMCRALAAAVVTRNDGETPLDVAARASLVLRAMLEILAIEPVQPRPQEPSS